MKRPRNPIEKDLSPNSQWYIGKERTLELTHFVRQYPTWMSALTDLNLYSSTLPENTRIQKAREDGPTDRLAISFAFYKDRMDMVNKAAAMTDKSLVKPILWNVVYNMPYDKLNARFEIMCSRDAFYEKVREFLWRLDKLRM